MMVSYASLSITKAFLVSSIITFHVLVITKYLCLYFKGKTTDSNLPLGGAVDRSWNQILQDNCILFGLVLTIEFITHNNYKNNYTAQRL